MPQFCKGLCNKHYWESNSGIPFSKAVPCDKCGDPLEYTRRVEGDAGARFHARCKPNGARFVSEDERCAIYERDGFACLICGGATIPRDGAWSPWEPSLDHIIPQSATKVADHSAENLRTCHAICNSLRGAGVLTDAEVVQKLREWEAANA